MLFRSMALMTGLNMAKAAVSLLVSVLVGRHIAPGDYGLVTFSIPLMALVTLLTDLGLSSALVRHPDLTPSTQARALSFLAWLGLVAGGLLAALAAPMEAWVMLPGLSSVLLAFGLVTALAIWATGPRALLEREMAYGQVSFIEGAALLLAIAAFLVLIALQAGLAAVLAFHIVLQAVRAVGFNLQTWRRYAAPGRWVDMRPLLAVGGWVLGTNLLSFLARNLDRAVIAPVLGASALGLYGMAYQFMTVPLVLISWPASGVLVSALSKLGDDPAEKRRILLAVMTLTAMVSGVLVPTMVFVAQMPVQWFFGDRWLGLHDLLLWMAPVGAIQSVASLSGAVLIQTGRLKEYFVIGVINASTVGAAFLIAVSHGLNQLVMAYSMVAMLVALLMIQRMCAVLRVSSMQLLMSLLPGAACGLALGGPYLATGGAIAASPLEWAEKLAVAFACCSVAVLLTRRVWWGAVRALRNARMEGRRSIEVIQERCGAA